MFLRLAMGGWIQPRLSTRTVDQPRCTIDDALAADITKGTYWTRPLSPDAQITVAHAGAVAPEAIEAVGLITGDRRDVGLLAVTSADRLDGGPEHARTRSRSCVEPCRTAARGGTRPLQSRDDSRYSSGDARLAGLRSGPTDLVPRRRALRSEWDDPRSLSPCRDQRAGDRTSRQAGRSTASARLSRANLTKKRPSAGWLAAIRAAGGTS